MKRLTKMLALGTVCLSCGVGALGCATTPPPPALRDARSAYQEAASSPAATRAQADVAEAKSALDRAEASFADDPNGAATLDWSYVASRKANSARAKANALATMDDLKIAKAELKTLQAQQLALQKQQLEGSRIQLAGAGQMIDSERRARAAAEKKTQDALATIAGLTAVQSDRGLVLTLSGSVLFASGQSVLLPAAQARLNDAATALKEDGRPMVIVGHTDSTGSDELNQKLSAARAESVRTYLVSRGVPSDRVKAEGAGKSQPIADNGTVEGRANNRRVEIILENAKP